MECRRFWCGIRESTAQIVAPFNATGYVGMIGILRYFLHSHMNDHILMIVLGRVPSRRRNMNPQMHGRIWSYEAALGTEICRKGRAGGAIVDGSRRSTYIGISRSDTEHDAAGPFTRGRQGWEVVRGFVLGLLC